MKHIALIISLIMVMSLVACSSTNKQQEERIKELESQVAELQADEETSMQLVESVDEQMSEDTVENETKLTSEEILNKYPTVQYEDIVSGKYSGQIVCIEAIVDNVYFEETPLFGEGCYSVDFRCWFQLGDTYILGANKNSIYKYDPEEDTVVTLEEAKKIDDGCIMKMVYEIGEKEEKGIFWGDRAKAVKVIDKVEDMKAFYNNIQSTYPEVDGELYEKIERMPDNYKETPASYNGEIFQIVSEEDNNCTYLIETEAGLVYFIYDVPENVRKMRFLEGDYVKGCGNIFGLKEYESLVQTNRVPGISGIILLQETDNKPE